MVFSAGDTVLVGYDAVKQQELNPYNTIYDAKRFIGKSFTQQQLDLEASRYSFKVKISCQFD